MPHESPLQRGRFVAPEAAREEGGGNSLDDRGQWNRETADGEQRNGQNDDHGQDDQLAAGESECRRASGRWMSSMPHVACFRSLRAP
jgi:hypothetical protein